MAKALPPSVVWIDDVESVFASGKKKGGGDDPGRIIKAGKIVDLVSHKADKKRLLDINDRVLVLGTSSQPYLCEKAKDYTKFKDFFPKVLFLPLPDYPSRQVLWTKTLQKNGVDRPNPDEIQTLSQITKYYASGSIVNVVKRTLTARRVDRLGRKPFTCDELIGSLAKEEPVYQNVDQELRDWYLKTLDIVKPGTAGGDGGKKKEGKGKKKK